MCYENNILINIISVYNGAIGAQMKIIRKGSDDYNKLVKETKARMDDLKTKEEAKKLKESKKLAKLNKTTNV